MNTVNENTEKENINLQSYKVAYFGKDIQTLYLLHGHPRLNLITVNLIEELLSHKTLNPVNAVFKYTYRLRYQKKNRKLEIFGVRLWKVIKGFSSSIYAKYAEYLIYISENEIPILNLNEINEVKSFIETEQIDLAILNISPLLPEDIIHAPKYKTINVHPAKLPKYRGSLPTLWSLKNKDKESAVSYFIVDADVDTGDIVAQYPFPIDPQDNAIAIERKIDEVVRKTLTDTLLNYVEGKITPVKQNHILASKTEKYLRYMRIDWENEAVEEIYNKVLLYPYLKPLHFSYTFFNSRKIHVKKAYRIEDVSDIESLMPGDFIVKDFHLLVRGKDGAISIPLWQGLSWRDSFLFLVTRSGNFNNKPAYSHNVSNIAVVK